MSEQEMGEPVACPQQICAHLLATAEEIADGFFVFRGDVNGRRRAGAIEDGELGASRRSVLTRSPGRRGMSAGAMTSHATPPAVHTRCSSNPHGPAS
jgi:hypothetical protein